MYDVNSFKEINLFLLANHFNLHFAANLLAADSRHVVDFGTNARKLARSHFLVVDGVAVAEIVAAAAAAAFVRQKIVSEKSAAIAIHCVPDDNKLVYVVDELVLTVSVALATVASAMLGQDLPEMAESHLVVDVNERSTAVHLDAIHVDYCLYSHYYCATELVVVMFCVAKIEHKLAYCYCLASI